MAPPPRPAANRASATKTNETIIAAILSAVVAAMALAYLAGVAGLTLQPPLIALAAAGCGVAVARWQAQPRDTRGRAIEPPLFVLVVAASWVYVMWLAAPAGLPVTDGPDVVHHLQLIHVIQGTRHLPVDPVLRDYLLEMMNYTPGSHLLAAMVSDLARVDALRVLVPIAAFAFAIKAGILYVLAARVLPDRAASPIYALAAPILLLVPAAYTLGSLFQFFFFAQVLSETFAVGMLLAVVMWTDSRRPRDLVLFAICGVGVSLAWPVWLGPAVLTLLAALVLDRTSWRSRFAHGAIALAPIAVVVGIHTALHREGAAIIGSSGAVTMVSSDTVGIALGVVAIAGAILAVRLKPARPVLVFLAAVILQALALTALDARAGSTSFYMPLKMVYLAVLPCTVLGALALGRLTDALLLRMPRARAIAALAPLVIAILLAAGRIPVERQRSPITENAYAAGQWARDHIAPSCVDYFSRHWLTGYWLHLDVLGNPRLSDRMRAETFEFRDIAAKWIEGRGLSHAIVEDLAALPKEVRDDMTVLHRFGATAIIANTRPAPCPPAVPPIWRTVRVHNSGTS